MKIVYVEAVLMDNNELIHMGKTLGFIGKKQRELIDTEDSGACKLTKPSQPIVAINQGNDATA